MRTAGMQGSRKVLGPQEDENSGMQGPLEVLDPQDDGDRRHTGVTGSPRPSG